MAWIGQLVKSSCQVDPPARVPDPLCLSRSPWRNVPWFRRVQLYTQSCHAFGHDHPGSFTDLTTEWSFIVLCVKTPRGTLYDLSLLFVVHCLVVITRVSSSGLLLGVLRGRTTRGSLTDGLYYFNTRLIPRAEPLAL
jgi:hypothetical protein